MGGVVIKMRIGLSVSVGKHAAATTRSIALSKGAGGARLRSSTLIALDPLAAKRRVDKCNRRFFHSRTIGCYIVWQVAYVECITLEIERERESAGC
jgi:hypothetical protein